MKKIVPLFIVLAIFFVFSGCPWDDDDSDNDANIAGTWDVDQTATRSGGGNDRWIITQTGSSVAVIFGGFGDIAGTVSGNSVTLTITSSQGTGTYTLTIDGDTITGTGVLGDQTYTTTLTKISDSTDIPQYQIPVASIMIDGNFSDWDSVTTSLTDETGDSDASASDITEIKFATNSSKTYIYCYMKLSATVSTSYTYQFYFWNYNSTEGFYGGHNDRFDVELYYNSGWYTGYKGDGDISNSFNSYTPTSGQEIELSFVIADLNNDIEGLGEQFSVGANTVIPSNNEVQDDIRFFGVGSFE